METIIYMLILLPGLLYGFLSLYFISKAKKQIPISLPINNHQPPISILKPIKGIDDNLEDNLCSFFELNYPDYEIIFGVDSEDDPAVTIIERVINKYHHQNARLVIDSRRHGLNPKVNNLINMYSYAKGQLILISDSNTKCNKDFLINLTAHFNDDELGMLTATIRGHGEKNIVSAMENIHLNTFVAPSIFAASSLADIQITIGKAILIRREALDAIGGFYSFTNYLAEDFMMGKKVKEVGYKVMTSPILIDNINEKIPLKKFINRHSRWSKMRFRIDPFHYLLEPLTNPVALGLLLLPFFKGILIYFLSSTLIKIILDYFISRHLVAKHKPYTYFFIPLKDLLIFAIWLIPFFNSRVKWRNNVMLIREESLLMPVS
ncbi:glycosyltransferase [Melioribacter sp. OK-6-Me]|uniref:glycosyltransferase n=1 Tax=unclassified Melioribacter TaxID=2627329 RepID=UPI003ED8AC7D